MVEPRNTTRTQRAGLFCLGFAIVAVARWVGSAPPEVGWEQVSPAGALAATGDQDVTLVVQTDMASAELVWQHCVRWRGKILVAIAEPAQITASRASRFRLPRACNQTMVSVAHFPHTDDGLFPLASVWNAAVATVTTTHVVAVTVFELLDARAYDRLLVHARLRKGDGATVLPTVEWKGAGCDTAKGCAKEAIPPTLSEHGPRKRLGIPTRFHASTPYPTWLRRGSTTPPKHLPSSWLECVKSDLYAPVLMLPTSLGGAWDARFVGEWQRAEMFHRLRVAGTRFDVALQGFVVRIHHTPPAPDVTTAQASLLLQLRRERGAAPPTRGAVGLCPRVAVNWVLQTTPHAEVQRQVAKDEAQVWVLERIIDPAFSRFLRDALHDREVVVFELDWEHLVADAFVTRPSPGRDETLSPLFPKSAGEGVDLLVNRRRYLLEHALRCSKDQRRCDVLSELQARYGPAELALDHRFIVPSLPSPTFLDWLFPKPKFATHVEALLCPSPCIPSQPTLALTSALRSLPSLLSLPHATPLFHDMRVLEREREVFREQRHAGEFSRPFSELLACAARAKSEGPWSVVDKLVTAPSGNRHDYHSRAPYYWPNPKSRRRDKTPYIHIDGKRAPGTTLYGKDSNMYDRDSLANMIRNTTCLGLASFFAEETPKQRAYAALAARNIRVWFLDKATRMNPNAKYAQVRLGHNNNIGVPTGVIDTKNIAQLLDVVYLLQPTNALSSAEVAKLREWMREYGKFLDTSVLGVREQGSINNHGTFFDVQRASIALFVGDIDRAFWIVDSARHRLREQVSLDGQLPHEMSRPTRCHYIAFGFQALLLLATIAQRVGIDLWDVRDSDGDQILRKAAVTNTPHLNGDFDSLPRSKDDFLEVHPERWLSQYYIATTAYPDLADAPVFGTVPPLWCAPSVAGEHDGMMMFWSLGLSVAQGSNRKDVRC